MATQTSERRPHVVILGGGFGGLAAARALKSAPVQVTLIDRNNYQAFQPLLYQVATAGLDVAAIGFPLRTLLRRHANTDVLMVEAESIDPGSQTVRLADGDSLAYDYLIVATGSEGSYFGHAEWAAHAPGLKNLADAIAHSHRVLEAFERAEAEHDPDLAARRAELRDRGRRPDRRRARRRDRRAREARAEARLPPYRPDEGQGSALRRGAGDPAHLSAGAAEEGARGSSSPSASK